ncbi:glycosyltransferase [Bacillus sp. FJAT-29937]|uniref:glycosyltransferase n=1 Tax=Bacillus sp. FJAT-29937 TaxID=1720553 RepID=UPI0008344FDD|nr:glycosyltransferase [Bacillus sp. FJAT-29937]
MKKLIKKVNRLIKKDPNIVVRKFISKLPRRIKDWILKFPDEKTLIHQVNEVRESHKGKTFYVFPLPSCPWGYMFQRPQQLARALANQGKVVFYMIDSSFPYEPDWFVRGISEVEQNIYLVNDNFNGNLFIKAFSDEEIYIWQYWPHQFGNIKKWDSELKNSKVIYDCIDHLETFLSYPDIKSDFLASLRKAKIVLATAKNIQRSVYKYRSDCLYIPNGVKIEDFTNYKIYPWPKIEEIRSNSDVVIGYYGAIAEWFDFTTIEYMAKNNPKWTIVLVGEIYHSVEEKVSNLMLYQNIQVLDRVEYKLIPQLLSNFDVAILPFILNNITLNTSPVKIFEYLAGGKPVVSSALPEVMDIDCIYIGKDSISFNNMVSLALQNKSNRKFINAMEQVARQNTWGTRIKSVNEYQRRVLEDYDKKNLNI